MSNTRNITKGIPALTGECKYGKLPYASEHAARKARGGNRNKGRRLRAYRCDSCGLWHLTSQGHTNE